MLRRILLDGEPDAVAARYEDDTSRVVMGPEPVRNSQEILCIAQASLEALTWLAE
jgi:hypothetical protein